MLDLYNNWRFHEMCYAYVAAGSLPVAPGYEDSPQVSYGPTDADVCQRSGCVYNGCTGWPT
jgi:hypothetical protein